MPGNIISLPCWWTPAEIDRIWKTLVPLPSSPRWTRPLPRRCPRRRRSRWRRQGRRGGGVLPTTFTSPLPPPEPGDPVPGSETRYRPYGELCTPEEPVAGLTVHTVIDQALDGETGLV